MEKKKPKKPVVKPANIDIDITGVGQRRQSAAPLPAPPRRRAAQGPEGVQAFGNDQQSARISHGQARRQRRKKHLWQAGFVAALLLVAVVCSLTVLFPISGFRVTGETSYTQEELIYAFSHEAGENIFRFRISEAERQMAKALPYLENIKVRRRLPGTVVFIVEQAVEYYYVPLQDSGVVLSQNLKVLRRSDIQPDGLCTIEGLQTNSLIVGAPFAFADEATEKLLKNLLAALAAAGAEKVTALDVSNMLELTYTHDNRVLVYLGTQTELAYKIQLANNILQTQIGENETGTLDASYPSKATFAP